jgi:hypothetical protein
LALALVVGVGFVGEAVQAQEGVTELTAEEAEALQFMREEEKLARDVYLTLNDVWNLRVFQNISKSEQTHMDAVKTLLDFYGLEDPVTGNDIGVFANPDLQVLYDQLVLSGSTSLSEALQAGIAIEEIDILDLQERIAQTDKSDIQLVYENLLRGSGNHLRAFVTNLERRTGETIQPQYMEQEEFEELLDRETGSSDGNGRARRYRYGKNSLGRSEVGNGNGYEYRGRFNSQPMGRGARWNQ